MAQAHYIDVDEEITSVIDRLRKSKSASSVFVVPQRSLVLQSIVNLKLLKREADKIRKKVIIVTQQEQGRNFAEKAGIETRDSVEDIEPEEKGAALGSEEKISPRISIPEISTVKKTDKRERLANLGSADFFETKSGQGEQARFSVPPLQLPRKEKIIKPLRKVTVSDIALQAPRKVVATAETFAGKRMPEEKSFGERQDRKIKTLFSYPPPVSPLAPKEEKSEPRKSRVRLFLVIAFVLLILAALAVAAYFFVPRAEVLVKLNYDIKDISLAFQAREETEDAGGEEKIVTARIFQWEEEISKEFNASGRAKGKTSKAGGKVVIFNEFSSSPQPLVASTRLVTDEGKLFRLVSGVVVPGSTEVEGGEIKPGAIEAEVVADEPGEQYNIGPATFKIPGFEGEAKYEKFYARSEKPMTGGSSAEGEAKIITQSDIDGAKSRFEEEVRDQIKEKLKNSLPEDFVLIEGAEKIGTSDLKTSVKSGEQKDSFSYTGKVSVQAIAFSENAVSEIIKGEAKEKFGLSEEQIIFKSLEYQLEQADFPQKSLKFKASSAMYVIPELSAEDLKHALLGRSADEIKSIINEYPSVKELEINFIPSFMTARIPRLQSRVEVTIESGVEGLTPH